MATLSDVNSSMTGKKKQEEPIQREVGSMSSLTTEQPIAAKAFHIFRLVKKKKGRTHIDGVCDFALNPKTKKRERIWLLNGADSIWQSELGELLKDKEYVKRNRRSLVFENGICRIPVIDERAYEYATVNTNNVGNNRNVAGKYGYYEYDAAEEQRARLGKQMNQINMVIKAKEMPVEKMKKLASFLGVSFVDDLGQPKGEDGIRSELMLKAHNQSELFAKYIDSKEVEVSYMVKKAIIEARIDLHGQSGNALWANGKGFIAKIPAARKAHEYLTELAMTNSEEGRRFMEQLQTFVN